MNEKLNEKIAMVEVLKDVASKLEYMYNDINSNIEMAKSNMDNESNADWLKESYARHIKDYERKISALDKISDCLAKLI